MSCAVSKRYRYLIDDNRPPFPMTRNQCWVYRKKLDPDLMRSAAQHLLGKHDFACFQTQGSPRTTTERTIFDVSVQQLENFEHAGIILFPPLICIEVQANGFLYNMMRAITGTLVLLSLERQADRMRDIIASRDRSQAGATAPPQGLYLIDVVY